MALSQPMSYQAIVNAIQLQALNDPTPPVAGSQEYQIYVNMINTLAIPTWEGERGVLWNELWVNEPNYYTIVANTTTTPTAVALPPDFKFLYDGMIFLTYPGSTSAAPNVRSFKVKMLPEMALNPRNSLPEFYITGNAVNGFNLVFGWFPQPGQAEIGATLAFRYYKYANTADLTTSGALSNPSDVPEMSDPNFIIYKVCAQVNANNFNQVLYQIMEDKANYSLLQMRIANDMSSNFQDDYVKDVDSLLGLNGNIPNRLSSAYWTNGSGWA